MNKREINYLYARIIRGFQRTLCKNLDKQTEEIKKHTTDNIILSNKAVSIKIDSLEKSHNTEIRYQFRKLLINKIVMSILIGLVAILVGTFTYDEIVKLILGTLGA